MITSSRSLYLFLGTRTAICVQWILSALNSKSLDKSFVYKGGSGWLDHFHYQSWLISPRVNCPSPAPINFNWHSGTNMMQNARPKRQADSFKCNYFNRSTNKPSNFSKHFFFNIFIPTGQNMDESQLFFLFFSILFLRIAPMLVYLW